MHMSHNDIKPTGLLLAKDELFDFAFDREDVKWLMDNYPTEAATNRNTVEYELHLLKIISVGWCISYFLEEHPYKDTLSKLFWMAVKDFSGNLSNTTGLMIGQDIDYFQVLRDRLIYYVSALSESGEKDPLTVIGGFFAEKCGNADDIFASITGSKLFMSVIGRIREYLDNIDLDPSHDNLEKNKTQIIGDDISIH